LAQAKKHASVIEYLTELGATLPTTADLCTRMSYVGAPHLNTDESDGTPISSQDLINCDCEHDIIIDSQTHSHLKPLQPSTYGVSHTDESIATVDLSIAAGATSNIDSTAVVLFDGKGRVANGLAFGNPDDDVRPTSMIPSTCGFPERAVSHSTTLMRALDCDDASVVRRLLTDRVSLETRNPYNLTPLMLASLKNNAQIVRMLLLSEVDIEAEDSNGWTALQLASEQGYTEVMRPLILARAHVDTVRGPSALALAAGRGHVEAVGVLLNAKASLDRKDAAGWTPLMYAVMNGHNDIVKLLIDSTVDIDLENSRGRTALHLAVIYGQLEAAELLLNAKARLEARDADGLKPLMLAAVHDRKNLAAMLIERRADIEAADAAGFTALSFAEACGHADIVQLLLEAASNSAKYLKNVSSIVLVRNNPTLHGVSR